ncbi:MAG TPA: hypothetical protein VN408_40290 [Actinoplanes sp.]|nr:hypothetical protein [Actinoplanes sp.]
MEAKPIPVYAEQTRALLWLQLFVNMIGILLFTFITVLFQPPLQDDDDAIFVAGVLIGLLLGGLLSAGAAKMFPRGWGATWILAVNAQVLTLIAVWSSWELGLYLGLGIVVTVGMVGWISVNLFRSEVRGFCFSRKG